jgi:hypothetical protein
MKPIKFKEHNTIFAKDQKPYTPLPAHAGDNGQVITCWKPTLRERVGILFGCPIWLSVLTFGGPLQPVKLEARRPFSVDHAQTGLRGFLSRRGLLLGAIALEVDKLDAVPEFQRAWYVEDAATKKFKLDPAKVEIEDVTGLKNTVAATRREAQEAKAAQERAVAEALKPFAGIDPEETRKLLSQFASDEEKRLIQAGHIDKVIATRIEKQRTELENQVKQAAEERDGALEVASTFMERVLDNHVRMAAAEAGVLPGAVEDALLRARMIFSLDDNGDAVQFGDDGETPVLDKEGKKPFSVKDWIEERRADCAHWFPAGASGGGAPGGKGKGGAPDLSHLTGAAKLAAAREAQQGK